MPGGLCPVMLKTLLPQLVMIIEDDPDFRQLCGVALESSGIDHLDFASTDDALKVIDNEEGIDLILLDMKLPGMESGEFVRLLRERGLGVPVVVVSGVGDVSEMVRVLDLGADDYLVKPISFRELMLRIRSVMRRVEGVKEGSVHPSF